MRENSGSDNKRQRKENILDESSSEESSSDRRGDKPSELIPSGSGRTGPRSGTLSRRQFLGGMGAAAVVAAVGCGDSSPSGVDIDGGPDDCEPDCTERACGPDPICGASCGECDPGHSCDLEGRCIPDEPDCEPDLFSDSFESADMSATNADGFRWANNNRTSVVTMDPGPLAVWNNGPVNNSGPEGADWTAFDGDYCLRFRYPAGEFWAEQRFDMGAPQPEIWIRYWLRVPTNFRHGQSSPTNNKFFALWMDGYSQHGEGPTIVWNFWREGDTDSSRFTYSVSQTGSPSGGHHSEFPFFIRSPEDQGRWMQVVLYAKMSTDAESMDGESRIYRRWEDEDSFTLIGETTNKNFSPPSNGPNGWKAGYIMGWSNPAYEETTEWLLDKFELSTESLLCDQAS